MKHFYLLVLVCLTTFTYAQNKKVAHVLQPYNISNIKLGMSAEDFLEKYIDSIPKRLVQNSSETFLYKSLLLNNIEVKDVFLKFYKNRLVLLSFHTFSSQMHSGLSAKYGYITSDESEKYDGNRTKIIGSYGPPNQSYDLFRIVYDGERLTNFIMIDLKGTKASEAEGF